MVTPNPMGIHRSLGMYPSLIILHPWSRNHCGGGLKAVLICCLWVVYIGVKGHLIEIEGFLDSLKVTRLVLDLCIIVISKEVKTHLSLWGELDLLQDPLLIFSLTRKERSSIAIAYNRGGGGQHCLLDLCRLKGGERLPITKTLALAFLKTI